MACALALSWESTRRARFYGAQVAHSLEKGVALMACSLLVRRGVAHRCQKFRF